MAVAAHQDTQASSTSEDPGATAARDALDALSLTSLMSSRLCHDLVNPVGALSSGLDVLVDPEMDEEMRRDAMDLVQSSTDKAVAALKFARLAYGLSGGLEHDVSLQEARDLLMGVYAHSKASLDWRVNDLSAPKKEAKALLLLAHAAMDCVPRGGAVAVTGGEGAYEITADGARVLLNDGVDRALSGDVTEITPKHAPLYLVGVIAREGGGAARARRDGERVVMSLQVRRAAA
ncbi:MAG: histidine phosphotransferase family protein [Pseudomonadota bacterium]